VRVIFLTHNYPRFDGDVPGAFLHPLARAVAERGHEVLVIAPSDRGKGGADELDGIPVERVRYAAPQRETLAYSGQMREAARTPGGLVALAGLWRALRRATRTAMRAGPSVVHAHWWVPAGVAVPPEARSVLTIHGTDGVLLRRSPMARLLGRKVIRRCGKVTAVSTSLATQVRDATGRTDVEVQAMPVDTTGWEWSHGGGGIVIVSRLTRQKRVDLALRALDRLAALGHGIPCTVIGDGPERPRLEALAQSLSNTSTTFLGSVSPAEAVSRLRSADLTIQASENEGFGQAAAEAIMSGVPVACCRDGGGLLDVVPESGAGRVAEPSPEALAVACRELLTDPQARTSAREIGSTWRERLAPEAVAQRFCGWYQEVDGG